MIFSLPIEWTYSTPFPHLFHQQANTNGIGPFSLCGKGVEKVRNRSIQSVVEKIWIIIFISDSGDGLSLAIPNHLPAK